ncbi:hypothetical protein [Buttiauxella agrestis]|uniref:Putative lipoprotein n=1 Tax=Buttiauxella agrestis ATCC 33320 TaxID=1006004 RepID=A0A085G0E4_9ENTR|nr:hypothetical protein [Buttiauxella agrestis]KFC77189.1 putative lipoprotein [Buttiauxella agrestis ATCC 33320]
MKKNNYIIRSIILIVFLFNLSGCDDGNVQDVKNKIQVIQNKYNNQEFEEIYDQTSNEFKKVSTRQGFVNFLQEKYLLLGGFRSSKVLFIKEKNENVVNITYLSVYEKYTLAEDITFKDEGDGKGLRLLQYTVDTGGKIVPVTKTESSIRIDIPVN